MHAQRKPSVSTSCQHHHDLRNLTDAQARWEIQRAERNAVDGALQRVVQGNVIRYLPLPTAPVVPRPGEEGEAPLVSPRWANLALALLVAGALMVTAFHKAGVL